MAGPHLRRCSLCTSEILGDTTRDAPGFPVVCLLCRLAAEEAVAVLNERGDRLPHEPRGGPYVLGHPLLTPPDERGWRTTPKRTPPP